MKRHPLDRKTGGNRFFFQNPEADSVIAAAHEPAHALSIVLPLEEIKSHTMKWIKANEKMPKHGEEVLVRRGAEFMLAVYNAEKKIFTDKFGNVFQAPNEKITWASMETAGSKD